MFDYVYCDHDNSASYQLKDEELVSWLTVVRKPCQTVCASCHSCVGMGCIPARRAMRPLIRPVYTEMFSLVFIMFWLRLHLLFTRKWWKQFGKWMFSKTASETCVRIYNNTIQYSMQETRNEKEAIWNWKQVSLVHIVCLGEGFDPLSRSGWWALQSWKVWLGGGRMSVYLWGTWWLKFNLHLSQNRVGL